MDERIDVGSSDVRVLRKIPVGVEQWVGVAALGGAATEVMHERIDVGLSDVGVLRKIPAGVEQRVGVAAFRRTTAEVVCKRVYAGPGNIGIFCQVPFKVENQGKMVEIPQAGISCVAASQLDFGQGSAL